MRWVRCVSHNSITSRSQTMKIATMPVSRCLIGLALSCLLLAVTLKLAHHAAPRATPVSQSLSLSPGQATLASSLTSNAAAPARRHQLAKAYGQLPLSFEANAGQMAQPVKFMSRGSGYSLFLTGTEAVLSLRDKRQVRDGAREMRDEKQVPRSSLIPRPSSLDTPAILHMKLVGAQANPRVTGAQELPGKVNYFIGRDKSKWRANVATYKQVRYGGVYPGVDLVYYGNQRQLEYDFVVAPGADPSHIQLGFSGAQNVRVDNSGALVLRLHDKAIKWHQPVIYQHINGQRRNVAGSYQLGTQHSALSTVGFRLAAYDHRQPLIIDPVLSYSTYLGGNGLDVGNSIAVDSSGNAYVTGDTASTTTPFPTTSGALQTTYGGGNTDAFVSKLDVNGALVYSTYLGGTGDDRGNGIAVDSSGNAYVTGATTSSTDFPTTIGALQTTYGGGSNDAFVFKLNASGSALVYSTYLGGNGLDYGNSIAVDSSGNAYVTGDTKSTTFPTMSPLQGSYGGGNTDTFVSKLNASGSALLYSTYFGSTGNEDGTGIAVDSSGNAYVMGDTNSNNLPTSPSAFQSTSVNLGASNPYDAFVFKLNASGSTLVYATYLGGSGQDKGAGIAVDGSGNAYVTGYTVSTDFPTTAGALQTTYGGNNDAFVSKLNASGSALVYSTYLGGSANDYGYGIAVDSSGNAYVVGSTASTNFPTTTGALQATNGGNNDAFVSKLNASGSALVYSTYLGGSGDDYGSGIAVDSSGNAYVSGYTNSTNFPTVLPEQAANSGSNDAFVAKFSAAVPLPSGAISWYRAEGNANDELGNNPGSLKNGTGFGPGEVGQAFDFDGVSRYVDCGTSPSLAPPKITVEFWLYARSVSGFSHPIARWGNSSSTPDSWLFTYPSTGLVSLSLANASGQHAPDVVSNVAVPLNQWHHIAGTYDGSAVMLYVDGQLTGQQSLSGPLNNAASTTSIGGKFADGGLNFPFDGRVDEATIYNRALSSTEILDIFNAGAAGKISGVQPDNVVTNTNDSGAGSLRNAIAFANADPGTTIKFNIPTADGGYSSATGVFTIKPTSALPTITADGTVIDGATQTAFTGNTNTSGPEIVIAGSQLAGASASGLRLNSSNNIINSLVINNFTLDGITINGAFSGNTITGCYLGTDATGTTALANSDYGVVLFGGATNNMIGGTTGTARNLISGNGFTGVGIADTGTANNLVQGNYIGTDASGTAAIPNQDGGIGLLNSTTGNTVGGTAAGAGNLISGNKMNGVGVSDAGTSGNLVEGNLIGTNAAGTAVLANVGDGVVVTNGAQSNTIGGTSGGMSNVIAFNSLIGVDVINNATGTSIRGNSIHDNGGLGIDLGGDGVTPNDAGDGDTGCNNLQNFPVITSVSNATHSVVSGTLNSTPNTAFTIDLYSNAAANSSGFGEGQTYLGSVTTGTTDANGNVAFTYTASSNLNGLFVSATATDPANNTSEFSIAFPGSNLVTTTADSGPGSLRAAIAFANNNPGTTIIFNIPTTDAGYNLAGATGAFTIRPATVLPSITANGTIIDGTTQTAFTGNTNVNGPEIIIDGSAAGGAGGGAANSIDGIDLHDIANGVVKSLVINNWDGGLCIRGSSATTVQGCYIGTDATGTVAAPNNTGIEVNNAANNNTIGDSTGATFNLISGNNNEGILLDTGTDSNTIEGNLIGTMRQGVTALGNGDAGIYLDASTNNLIGGTGNIHTRNYISGNTTYGIYLHGASTGNTIDDNYVGLAVNGTTAVAAAPTGNYGIYLAAGASSNIIGDAGVGNVISSNGLDGLTLDGTTTTGNQVLGNLIGTDNSGAIAVANSGSGVSISGGAHDNIIGGSSSATRNLISGNSTNGITISSASHNTVQDNYVGLNASGNATIANAEIGVSLTGDSQNNVIGGNTNANPLAGNVIAGNGFEGILMSSAAAPAPSNNTVSGNLIGLDATGTTAIANSRNGINITDNCANNVIGGPTAGDGNVISGNLGHGLAISGTGANGNKIQGNLIGVNRAGTAAIKNDFDGIVILNGPQNTVIGGTGAAKNVLSGNALNGLSISGTSNTTAQGNYIGTNAAGTGAVPNGSDGILVNQSATTNTIGGTTTGAGNLIAGNSGNGIEVNKSYSNTVSGNYIGTQGDGKTALGNTGYGILLTTDTPGNDTSSNTIGGTTPPPSSFGGTGAGNLISGNQAGGIQLAQASQLQQYHWQLHRH